jgi:endonuclease/exonuclease/phosphatase (EEP) superfamily protein YafD
MGPGIWRVLGAMGAILLVTTLFGFAGRWHWFLDLFSHFRVQYAAFLVALGAVFLAGRRWRVGMVFAAAAAVNLGCVLPLYFGDEREVPPGAAMLRVIQFNIHTGNDNVTGVRAVIEEAHPDLVVLQEIDRSWAESLAWLRKTHPHFLERPRTDNFGIGLYSRLPLADAEVVTFGAAAVPSVRAWVQTSAGPVFVLGTHPLPPAGARYSRLRNAQLEEVPDHLPEEPAPVLVLGDLNTAPWNVHFRRLLHRTRLRDSTRGFGVQPTWPAGAPLLWIPLDHCLFSPGIVICDRTVGPSAGSDHYPLIVDVAIPPPDDR